MSLPPCPRARTPQGMVEAEPPAARDQLLNGSSALEVTQQMVRAVPGEQLARVHAFMQPAMQQTQQQLLQGLQAAAAQQAGGPDAGLVQQMLQQLEAIQQQMQQQQQVAAGGAAAGAAGAAAGAQPGADGGGNPPGMPPAMAAWMGMPNFGPAPPQFMFAGAVHQQGGGAEGQPPLLAHALLDSCSVTAVAGLQEVLAAAQATPGYDAAAIVVQQQAVPASEWGREEIAGV